MLKKLVPTLFLIAVFAQACSDDDSYPMCDCDIDEICVDDHCKKYPDDFAPAPSDQDE